MASNRNIVLIALFFLIATPPHAHGVIIGGGDVANVKVLGIVSCAVPGTLPNGTPLPLLKVNITCNGGAVTLGQAITNSAGVLNATFNIPKGLHFDTSTCVAAANVSGIASCRDVLPTGTLRLSLVLVSVVEGLVQFVLGLILGST